MKARALPLSAARVASSVALVVCGLLGWTPRAEAQADLLLGGWRQVASSAGHCPTCEVRFGIAGLALRVDANNGWSATVSEQPRPGVIAAAGDGRWSGLTGRLPGKIFDVDFELRGDRLFMTMRIRQAGGTVQTVRAAYERPWFGS